MSLENNIKEYLMPDGIRLNPTDKKSIEIKQRTYIDFYKKNLESKISIIKDIENVSGSINEYINLKIEERVKVFGDDNHN